MSSPDLVLRTFDSATEATPLLLDPKDPMGVARAFVVNHPWTLARHDRAWLLWDRTRYRPLDEEVLRAEMWMWLDAQATFAPTPRIVKDALMALGAIRLLPPGTSMPSWLRREDLPDPDRIVPLHNGLLDVTEDDFRLLPHTPHWFSANCLPHPYLPDAECPAWDEFLDQVFEGDGERKSVLQQWFGYNMTRDTRQHKFALLYGPPRSGKSTTLRVLNAMLGAENVATPALDDLWRFYGLTTIAGKMAALVPDAHLGSRSKEMRDLEKLKSIVGGDPQNVDRKGRDELANVAIAARFSIATNEMFQLPDTSAALRTRMLVIPFNVSFARHEDRGLLDRLLAEMPGIVAWSVNGLKKLREAKNLIQPAAGVPLLDSFTRLCSPIKEFLEDWCVRSPEATIPTKTLFEAWREWCRSNCQPSGNASRFGEMLRAADHRIKRVKRGRDATNRQIYHYQGVTLESATRLVTGV